MRNNKNKLDDLPNKIDKQKEISSHPLSLLTSTNKKKLQVRFELTINRLGICCVIQLRHKSG